MSDYSLSGWRPNPPLRSDSKYPLRGSYFDTYAQNSSHENASQIMDGALKLIVDDPHDRTEVVPVVERLKELWRDGDTVGTLLTRYHQTT